MFWQGNLREREYLEDLGIDGRGGGISQPW